MFLGGIAMTVKKAVKLTCILLIAGIVIMLLGAYTLCNPLFVAGALVATSCLIPYFRFYRCPHCGRHLCRNEGKFCQYCGKRIE